MWDVIFPGWRKLKLLNGKISSPPMYFKNPTKCVFLVLRKMHTLNTEFGLKVYDQD